MRFYTSITDPPCPVLDLIRGSVAPPPPLRLISSPRRIVTRALGPLNGPPLRRENPAVVMLIDTVRRALTDLPVVRHRVIERDRDPSFGRFTDVTVMPTVRAEMSRFDKKFDKPRIFARCISYATRIFEAQRRQQPKGS
jgi:hypothetical protein